MTRATEGYDIRKRVSFVRVFEITNPLDVMNVRITSKFFTGTTALLTPIVVTG
jgi:hypothetical protein